VAVPGVGGGGGVQIRTASDAQPDNWFVVLQ